MSSTQDAARALRADLRGPVYERGAPGPAPRFENPEIEWDSQIVAYPADVRDVVAAMRIAAAQRLEVGVRGGSVGWVGAAACALLLDMRHVDKITVDRASGTVTAGAGALWGDVHRALAPHGLAAAGPQFPRLSVAGHVLGGGHGWLSRKLGWASDTLESVELVTAAGELVRASADHEPELFWGLRGAGHNLGVAVSLTLRTIPLRTVTAGVVWFDPAQTRAAFELYRDWAPSLPDEVSTILGLSDLPPQPGRAQRPSAHVLFCHCGTPDQAKRDLTALRRHRAIVLDTSREMTYVELAAGNDVFASGLRRRSRMRYLRGLPDDVIALTAQRFAAPPPLTMMSIHHYGGALGRVPEDATAMSHRCEEWNYMIGMTWSDPRDGAARRSWQDTLLSELDPYSSDAVYVNYLCQEPERVARAYNPSSWERLRALKGIWDPENRISHNHNIPPRGVTTRSPIATWRPLD